MSELAARLRDAAARLSPSRRRWDSFLQSLDLDAARLPRPLPAPRESDFIICGISRSGTSLLCAQLFQPPRVVTAMEPWIGMRLPPRQLFETLRSELRSNGCLQHTRLDVAALHEERTVKWVEGEIAVAVDVDEEFHLGVKWPAYWRYLELLPETKFLVCVRDPVETIASFQRTGGRLRRGLDYDIAFNREMNAALLDATQDPKFRRILFYDYVYSRVFPYLERPNVLAVRYERWFEDPNQLLGEIGAFLGTELARTGTVELRRGPARSGLSDAEEARIRQLCSMGRVLGY